jgi:hypothetical protein
MTTRLGVGWSTSFKRPWPRQVLYRQLRYAYRAPAFFAAEMVSQHAELAFMRFDDDLRVDDLDGTVGSLATSVDVLYLAAHGSARNGIYRASLHDDDWTPAEMGLGSEAPAVAVFDTCDLVDLGNPRWHAEWSKPSVGRALRLVLGFASQATVSPDTTRRGAAFARNLAVGIPLASAWLRAVHDTGFAGLDVGIAIALGDDAADAERVLREATLDALPGPRMVGSATVVHEVTR